MPKMPTGPKTYSPSWIQSVTLITKVFQTRLGVILGHKPSRRMFAFDISQHSRNTMNEDDELVILEPHRGERKSRLLELTNNGHHYRCPSKIRLEFCLRQTCFSFILPIGVPYIVPRTYCGPGSFNAPIGDHAKIRVPNAAIYGGSPRLYDGAQLGHRRPLP